MERDMTRAMVRIFAFVLLITGILYAISGALLLVAGNDTLLNRAIGPESGFMRAAVGVFDAYVTTSAVLIFILAALYIITAIGLFFGFRWARVLGIIVSIISLFGFPLGTLVGIFGLIACIAGGDAFIEDKRARTDAVASKEVRWR